MKTVEVLQAKLHRATITRADLHYEGSISIDPDLLDLAGLKAYQKVEIYDITNGARFATYIIEGERSSGMIQVNGAAAHLVNVGDLIIICAYITIPLDELQSWEPRVVLLDPHNQPKTDALKKAA